MTDRTGKGGETHRTKLIQLAAGMAVGLGFGLVMSLVSNGFVAGVLWLTSLRERQLASWLGLDPTMAAMLPLICLLVAAFLILQVRRLFGIARWHGPADSIFAAHRTDNELDIRSGFGSTIAALISAGGGASVGQYGPLVHFGATMGSAFRTLTGGRLTTDVFIGCGVAGAIAAGFNAPIAGVVFAHEAILRHFSMRAIAPIAIASISSSGFHSRSSAPLRCWISQAWRLTSELCCQPRWFWGRLSALLPSFSWSASEAACGLPRERLVTGASLFLAAGITGVASCA